MIDGVGPFPKYKDSGLPWLPRVPAAWSVVRNGLLFAQRNKTGQSDLPILEVSLRSGVRVRDMREGGRKQVMSDRSKYKQARAGDLAYNTMRMWQGAVGVAPVDGLVSPAYVVARPVPDVDAAYFARLYRTAEYMREIDTFSRGIVKDRNRLYWEAFKQIPTPCPPHAEQTEIVRFLVHADRQVRKAIHCKRQVSAHLEEQKQALIQRAMTRGIAPTVRLKASGVSWLGDVPETWTVKRFKFVVRVNSGQVDPRLAAHRGKLLIAPDHVESRTGRLLREETAESQGADSGKYEVRAGQVIYSKIRPKLRKATIAPTDGLCSADMYAITPRAGTVRESFLLLLMLSDAFTRYVEDCSLRVAMPKVNRDALGDCWLWYPSLREQDQIVQHLSSTLEPFDVARTRIELEIARIREYYDRLTALVVTGVLDVRAAAARLPQDDSSPIAADEPDTIADDDEPLAITESVGESEGCRT